jgi:type I restriction enzyme M protein
MVKAIDPKIGETVYDPGCGTGGFLAQTYEHIAGRNHSNITSPDQLDTLRRQGG